MHCDEILENLGAYLDGELEESELELVRSHLQDCKNCLNEMGKLKSLLGSLHRIENVSPPLDLLDKTHKKLSKKTFELSHLDLKRTINRYLAPVTTGLVAAGVLLFFLGGKAAWLRQEPRDLPSYQSEVWSDSDEVQAPSLANVDNVNSKPINQASLFESRLEQSAWSSSEPNSPRKAQVEDRVERENKRSFAVQETDEKDLQVQDEDFFEPSAKPPREVKTSLQRLEEVKKGLAEAFSFKGINRATLQSKTILAQQNPRAKGRTVLGSQTTRSQATPTSVLRVDLSSQNLRELRDVLQPWIKPIPPSRPKFRKNLSPPAQILLVEHKDLKKVLTRLKKLGRIQTQFQSHASSQNNLFTTLDKSQQIVEIQIYLLKK
jgi:hypothetical protein